MESPEGSFNRDFDKELDIPTEKYKPLPQDKIVDEKKEVKKPIPERIRKWVEEAKPVLEQYGNKVITDKQYEKYLRYERYTVFAWILVLLAMFIGGFVILGANGMFKSDVTCQAPNVTTSCPANPACPTIPTCPNLKCPDVNLSCNVPNRITVVNGT